MREIKFRAWVEDEMVFDCFGIDIKGQWIHIADQLFYDRPDFVLMQYTGLKDATGKEIYEGDILQNWDNFYFSVVWEDGCFMVEDYCELGSSQIKNYDLEIIGNIYENPELIKSAPNSPGGALTTN